MQREPDLRSAAISILYTLRHTIIPLMARAAVHPTESSVLQVQECIKLEYQLFIAANQMCDAAYLVLKQMDGDEASTARKGLLASDTTQMELSLRANELSARVERALRSLSPEHDVMGRAISGGERLPAE